MPSTEARLGESLLCGTSHLHLLQSVGQVNDVGFGDVSLAWTVLTGDVFHMDEDDWLPVAPRPLPPIQRVDRLYCADGWLLPPPLLAKPTW